MRYDELIYDPLMEAQLTPGQVKAIKIKIGEYENKLKELDRQKYNLDDRFRFGSFPDELKDKIDAYVNAYTDAIEKLKAQLRQENSDDQFLKFIAGIKKNCSEAIVACKHGRSLLYAGFKNASDKTALYAKPPERMTVPDSYKQRHFDDLEWLIEDNFQLGDFDNSVLCTSEIYNVQEDSRTAYIVFPRNGFKYFYSKNMPKLIVGERGIPNFFDRDEIRMGYDYFIKNPEMFEKFRAAGGKVPYAEEGSAGASDGFMGAYTWVNNLAAISKMFDQGVIPEDWLYHTDWKHWVTKHSFQEQAEITNTDLPYAIKYGHDVVIKTAGVYAIHSKYEKTVRSALNIQGYY